MLNNKGFTVIEMLFVISLILLLSVLTVSVQSLNISEETIVNDVTLYINQAKTHAMVYKEDVDIRFDEESIKVISLGLNKTYKLPRGKFNMHTISFNEFGHIINPKSVYLYLGNKEYQFVFQIGVGSYYVK